MEKFSRDLLDKNNIPHELIWVNGETREANIIVETDLNRHTHLTTYGYGVTEAECQPFVRENHQVL